MRKIIPLVTSLLLVLSSSYLMADEKLKLINPKLDALNEAVLAADYKKRLADIDILKEALAESQNLFTSLCIEDNNVGYHWENNRWVPTQFSPEKYIVQKLVWHQEVIPDKPVCLEGYYPPWATSSGLVIITGRYNIRKHGEEISGDDLCSETWKRKNGKFVLDRLKCDSVNFGYTRLLFKPNGYFHKSNINSNLEEQFDHKDSLGLSVGKCSVISQ